MSSHFEQQHVHTVYNQIAPHFSSTRYKPWPIIHEFLNNPRYTPAGTLIADMGCGNGKYMTASPTVFYCGSDRSLALLRLCHHRKPTADVVCADGLRLPYRRGCFQVTLSVAVVHHFSTYERRVHALMELVRITAEGGYLLVYVWALEQGAKSRLNRQQVLGDATLDAETGDATGVLVEAVEDSSHAADTKDAKGESQEQGAETHDNQPQKDNNNQDVYVPWTLADGTTVQRYYHLFRKNELQQTLQDAVDRSKRTMRIEQEGYDRDNWYLVIQLH